jgi:hypothetical protein
MTSELTPPGRRLKQALSAWPATMSGPVSVAGHCPLGLTGRKRRRIV